MTTVGCQMTRKIVPEITYNLFSVTLNLIPVPVPLSGP